MSENSDAGQGTSGPPPISASVGPPRDLHPTSDIRFVIWQMSKMDERITELVGEIKKQNTSISDVNMSLIKFKTAFYAIMVCTGIFLPAFGTVVWWAMGERINAVLKPN